VASGIEIPGFKFMTGGEKEGVFCLVGRGGGGPIGNQFRTRKEKGKEGGKIKRRE